MKLLRAIMLSIAVLASGFSLFAYFANAQDMHMGMGMGSQSLMTMSTTHNVLPMTQMAETTDPTGAAIVTPDVCEDTACLSAIDYTCLEHCIAAAVLAKHDFLLSFVQLSIVIAASVFVLLLLQASKFFIKKWEWYNPLYLFTTVRLLE